MRTIADVTAALRAKGYPLELVRGNGYLYFVYDDIPANIWETKSIAVCYFKHQTPAQWVEDGEQFIKELKEAGVIK